MLKRTPPAARLPLAAMFTVLLLASFAAAAVRLAGGSPLLKVELDGVVSRNGSDVHVADAGRVVPGEVLTWSMTVTNRGDAPAPDAQLDGEISPATVYVPGSARGDGSTVVQFSIDGGRKFSERPQVAYVEDGVEKYKDAPVESYTNVRFKLLGQIKPGEARTLHYQTRVR